MQNLGIALITLLIAIQPAVALADFVIPAQFSHFATHPGAMDQPTTRGRTIRGITYFEGKLYTGYGDWAADNGPIRVQALDPVSAEWSPVQLTYPTEAISHFRNLNGTLYTPNVDPLNTSPPGSAEQPAGFAFGNSSHHWNSVVPTLSGTSDPLTAYHVFDINRTPNGDLFLTGSLGNAGMVWRSVDGGATFAVEQQTLPPPESSSFAFSRYVGAAVYNGELYVQRADFNVSGQNDQSLRFDGNSWHIGPDLLSQNDGFMTRPEQFGDELIYLSRDLSDGYLYRFDGAESQRALSSILHDFQVLDDALVVLTLDGELLRTEDLADWTSLGYAPLDARSFEFVGDTIYVGTANAEIYSRGGFGSVQSIPEPSVGKMVVFAMFMCLRIRQRYSIRFPS